MQNHKTREDWLLAAVELLKPLFTAKGYTLPPCQVSCGFTSTGVRSGHIGQCWSTKSAGDGLNQIFIAPTLGDAFNVIDTLVHELVHAVDDCEHKHGKEFKKMALKLGLKGPMRSAGAGPSSNSPPSAPAGYRPRNGTPIKRARFIPMALTR